MRYRAGRYFELGTFLDLSYLVDRIILQQFINRSRYFRKKRKNIMIPLEFFLLIRIGGERKKEY